MELDLFGDVVKKSAAVGAKFCDDMLNVQWSNPLVKQ